MSKFTTVVTTAPREKETVHKCLASLLTAGFSPTVFAEPGSQDTSGLETFTNKERLGLWRNWVKAASWALEQDTEYVITCQDDIVIHPDSLSFLEKSLLPGENVGLVSLYCSRVYEGIFKEEERQRGYNKLNANSLWGACCLLFPREVLRDVLEHQVALEWTGPPDHHLPPEEVKNSDTVIGTIIRKLRRDMWFLWPSLVNHIGEVSSVGNADNTGDRNAEEIVDFGAPLTAQIEPTSVSYDSKGQPKKAGWKGYDAAVLKMWEFGAKTSFCIPLNLWQTLQLVLTERKNRGGDLATLEFGSGVSTELFRKYCPYHIALEQNRALAKFLGVEHSGLVGGMYDRLPPQQFDVILVDGPFQGNREKALPYLINQLNNGATIFIDDLNRQSVRDMFVALVNQTDSFQIHQRWGVCYPTALPAK